MDSEKQSKREKGSSIEGMIQVLAEIQRSMLKEMNELESNERIRKMLKRNKKVINGLFGTMTREKRKSKKTI